MVTWANNTTAGRLPEELEAWLNTDRVCLWDYASGDGSDEYVDLQAAMNAAGSTRSLFGEPGKTYTVGTKLAPPAGLRWYANGCTVKKTVGLNDYAIEVTSASVEFNDLNVDGNRAGGNTHGSGCIQWLAAGGVMRRVVMTQTCQEGLTAKNAGTTVDCYDCEASDHVSGTNTGDGFAAYTNAVIRLYNFTANNNDRWGVIIDPSAGDGCYLDGDASNNLNLGVYIGSNKGTGGRIIANNNKNFGIYGFLSNDWSFDYIEVDDCGAALHGEYTPNPSATGVNIAGCLGWQVGTLVTRRAGGYGLAVLSGTGPVPSSGCHFGSVYVQNCGDPGIIVGGSSNNNTFGIYSSVDNTLALSFDEGSGAANHNHFAHIHAVRCLFAVHAAGSGSNNTYGHIVAEDCTSGIGGYQSLIKWDTGCVGNVVARFDSYNPNTTAPAYLLECVGAAAGNKILNANAMTPPTTGLLLDAGGTNRVAVEGGLATTVQALNYTLVTADAVSVVEGTKATAQTVTVPPNSSVAFPIGTVIEVVQQGAGQITLTAGAGVTIRTASSLTTRAQYSSVFLRKRGVNEWVANGDLT